MALPFRHTAGRARMRQQFEKMVTFSTRSYRVALLPDSHLRAAVGGAFKAHADRLDSFLLDLRSDQPMLIAGVICFRAPAVGMTVPEKLLIDLIPGTSNGRCFTDWPDHSWRTVARTRRHYGFCRQHQIKDVIIDGRDQESRTNTMESFNFGSEVPAGFGLAWPSRRRLAAHRGRRNRGSARAFPTSPARTARDDSHNAGLGLRRR